MRRLAGELVVDAARADDVAQQTLLTALERPPADVGHPRAWLARVARSVASRLHRTEERRQRHETAAAECGVEPSAHEIVAQAELQRTVVDAVLALDEPYRTAMLLRWYEGRPPRAIARELRIPAETARTRLKRGLELLRAELVHRRGGGGEGGLAMVLLALLDDASRRAVRRAVVAGSSGSAAAGGAGLAASLLGAGAIGMSTKAKLAAAAAVFGAALLFLGTFGPADEPTPRDAAGRNEGAPLATVAQAAPTAPEPARMEEPVIPDEPRPVDVAPGAPDRPTRCAVEGTVRDSRGSPLVDATVLLWNGNHGDSPFRSVEWLLRRHAWDLADRPIGAERSSRTSTTIVDGAPVIRTSTDMHGSFRFEDLAPSVRVDLAAIHVSEGMAVANGIALEEEQPVASVEIRLPESMFIVGTVRDADGQPITRARLGFSGSTGSGESKRSVGFGVESGADGAYRTPALPYEHYSILCDAVGYVRQRRELSVLPGEREREVSFVLEGAAILRGRIVRPDGTDAGLAGVAAEVAVWGAAVDPLEWKDGPGLTAGQGMVSKLDDHYEVTCERGDEKFISLWSGNVLLGYAEIDPTGPAPNVAIDLSRIPVPERRLSLTIEVVEAESASPVPRFTVDLWRDPIDDPHMAPFMRNSRVRDSSGRAILGDLEPGHYDVAIRADGQVPRLVQAHLSADSSESILRVEVHEGVAWIRGQVLDGSGAPIGDADVVLLDPDGRCALPSPECRRLTNREGHFEYDSLAEGEYILIASREGFAPAAVAVSAGDENALLSLVSGTELTFRWTPIGSAYDAGVQYVVRDRDGVPLVDHRRHGMQMSIWSLFKTRLAPGAYTAEVFAPAGRSGRVPFVAPEGAVIPIDLLFPGSSVDGR